MQNKPKATISLTYSYRHWTTQYTGKTARN